MARLDELVIAHSPSVMCYYCGSNDTNYAVPPKTIVANTVKTFEILQHKPGKVTFIYLSIFRAPQKMDRWDDVQDVNT